MTSEHRGGILVASPAETFFGRAETLTEFGTLLSQEAPVFASARTDGGSFSATFSQRRVDGVTFATVDHIGSELIAGRSDADVRRDPSDTLLIVLPLSGACVLSQSGRTTLLQQGELALAYCGRPHSMRMPSHARTFTAVIPRSLIAMPIAAFTRLTASVLPRELASVRVAAAFIAGFADAFAEIEGPAGAHLAHHLMGVVRASLSDVLIDGRVGRSVGDLALLAEITDDILLRLGDATLTPQSIADAHHISLRRLHALFRSEGVSVSRWVRDRRLQAARADLAAPGSNDLAIGEIAQRWGVDDAAYFSRLFRAAYGESPRQWRSRALSSGNRLAGVEA